MLRGGEDSWRGGGGPGVFLLTGSPLLQDRPANPGPPLHAISPPPPWVPPANPKRTAGKVKRVLNSTYVVLRDIRPRPRCPLAVNRPFCGRGLFFGPRAPHPLGGGVEEGSAQQLAVC